MKIKSTTLLLLVLLVSTASSLPFFVNQPDGIIRHDTEMKKYIELGSRPEFNCIGRYSESVESTDYAVGVLITPKWVLTAQHFVQDSSVWKFGDTFYKTKRVIRHPEIKPDAQETQWNGWDMALIALEYPVFDIVPAKRYYGDQELGQTITKVGYGYIGNGKTGMDDPRKQIKLGGQNVVDAIGGTFEDREFSTNVMVCDFDNPESNEFNHFGSPTH